MRRKKATPDEALASDDTFASEPRSDEARLPIRGALAPERKRDGTAESSGLHDLTQRAVESGDDPEAPLDFEPPARDARDNEHRERD